MPFLSESDANERLNLSKALNAQTILSVMKPCRDTGIAGTALRYSDQEKVLFGVLGTLDGPTNASKALDISYPTISASMLGKTYANGTVSPDIKSKVDSAVARFRERITALSSQKIEAALERITDEKLDDIKKATELAQVACSLAKLNSDINPVDRYKNDTNVQFNIFRPRMRNEDEYEVLQVVE
jgi:hypothetical protein